MSKIAFIYGSFSIGGRLFDFRNLFDSPRGLTGSELSCIMFAKEMAARGHEVHLFIEHSDNLALWDSIHLEDIHDLSSIDSSYDVALAWNEPDALRNVSAKLRVVNQQLNDFAYCKPGYDDFVDIYTSPSQSHMEFIKNQTPSPHKWTILANGCSLEDYETGQKVPGRIIYASSPDRGLHLLLQCWPKIRKHVPEAHLRIFYNLDDWLGRVRHIHGHPIIDMSEYGCRSRYIEMSIRRMNNLNIEKVGSVSRNRMKKEMSEALILAYPCDTARFTEGFSVTTLEACASRTCPIISSTDSLGQIYGGHVAMVQDPVKDRLEEFQGYVIRSLIDENFRNSIVERSRDFSLNFSWKKLTDELEKIIG